MLFNRMKDGALLFLLLGLPTGLCAQASEDSVEVTVEQVSQAEKLIGLEFTGDEIDSMLTDLNDNLNGYRSIRGVPIENAVAPSLYFSPLPTGFTVDTVERPIELTSVEGIRAPSNVEDLAFFSVRGLGELLRTRQITSTELTKLCLERLKKYDPQLHCVITLTEDLALQQAAQADSEIAAGNYRGPLHGIPYGAKDLLAVKGYPTTWGAAPYKDQVIDENATGINKLNEAGAVLVAKLSMGALAWGDVWFGDTTRNPWNPEQGSSGSSAGSASAVSAGLVPFAIGTETWGSIVSPSTRCGTTGLRPTFGRVSRTGAMALSWSMDKIGPICRTVEDCAIVFDAIRGSDGLDKTVVDASFNYTPQVDLKSLKVGYLKQDFENDSAFAPYNDAALQKLSEMGVELIEIELPDIQVDGLPIILSAEAAAAFDELTRSNRDDLLVRQVKAAWPNVFRSSRLIPAVEYIQANRIRTKLIEKMAELMQQVDVYVSPSFEGNNLLMTNLTGNPCVVLPNGFTNEGTPVSITFIGRLYDEATLLSFARAYQSATDFHTKHPPLFN